MGKEIGFVLGNRPSTPLEFWVGINKGNLVQLDDIVVAITELENGKKVHFYGIVTELQRYLEGAEYTFDSQDFRNNRLPAHIAYVAKVQVSRILEDIYVPPFPGDPVYFAGDRDVGLALYFDQMEVKIPAGLLQNGLGKNAAEIAVALAGGTEMADVDGAQEWTSPAGTALSAKFLAPVPVTIDNLNAVLDAGWISKEALCQGVTDVAACN